MSKNDVLRRIPKVDEVLAQPLVFALFEKNGREAVTAIVREVTDRLRAGVLAMDTAALEQAGEPGACVTAEGIDLAALSAATVAEAVVRRFAEKDRNNLYGVINATGTILHTNLGRAPLCRTVGWWPGRRGSARRLSRTSRRYRAGIPTSNTTFGPASAARGTTSSAT